MRNFRISTLLLIFAVVGVTLGWVVERRKLRDEIRRRRPGAASYSEKHDLWSPENHLYTDTATVERKLAPYVEAFEGRMVESSQGLGRTNLRQPSLDTLDNVVTLLHHDDVTVRILAAQLTALYLQAVSGSKNLDGNSFETRVHFQQNGIAAAKRLLADPNTEVRQAGALIIGNTLPNARTMDAVIDAFDQETDTRVMTALAWAYWKLGHNYDRALE